MAREATAFFDIAGIGWSQAVAPVSDRRIK